MRTLDRKANSVALCGAIFFAAGFSASAMAASSPQVASFDSGDRDHASAMTTDSLGNSVVSGQVNGAFGVLKYDPQGALLWSYRFTDSVSSFADSAESVLVDGAGNVYAAGRVMNSTSGSDWLTVKLAPDGHQLWSRKISASVGNSARASKIVADRAGNVYVGGQLNGIAGGIAKYAADGALLWQRSLAANNANDEFVSMASDASGNLVVIGQAVNMMTAAQDAVTIKLDPQGATLWRVTLSEIQRMFFPRALAITQAGQIWVTGIAQSTENDAAIPPFTIKYDGGGNTLRVIREGGSSIALDFAENILLSSTLEAATLNDRRSSAAKFDSQGNKLWETIVSSETSAEAFSFLGSRIVADAAGNIVVANSIDTLGANGVDYLVAKLDTTGAVLWQHRFNGAVGMRDSVRDLSLDVFGNAFVTGSSSISCTPGPSCDSINTLIFPQGVTPAPTSTLPSVTPPPTVPNAPSGLSATVASTSITLRWLDNATTETGFAIERCAGKGCSFAQIAVVGANVTTFIDSGLALNTSFTYRVRAFNGAGNSAFSNTIAAKTPRR